LHIASTTTLRGAYSDGTGCMARHHRGIVGYGDGTHEEINGCKVLECTDQML
jgi:hypothetical protein